MIISSVTDISVKQIIRIYNLNFDDSIIFGNVFFYLRIEEIFNRVEYFMMRVIMNKGKI